ncbi:hypothetical protein ACFU99_36785 [Streptomyces sp. NPDC057654]
MTPQEFRAGHGEPLTWQPEECEAYLDMCAAARVDRAADEPPATETEDDQ